MTRRLSVEEKVTRGIYTAATSFNEFGAPKKYRPKWSGETSLRQAAYRRVARAAIKTYERARFGEELNDG